MCLSCFSQSHSASYDPSGPSPHRSGKGSNPTKLHGPPRLSVAAPTNQPRPLSFSQATPSVHSVSPPPPPPPRLSRNSTIARLRTGSSVQLYADVGSSKNLNDLTDLGSGLLLRSALWHRFSSERRRRRLIKPRRSQWRALATIGQPAQAKTPWPRPTTPARRVRATSLWRAPATTLTQWWSVTPPRPVSAPLLPVAEWGALSVKKLLLPAEGGPPPPPRPLSAPLRRPASEGGGAPPRLGTMFPRGRGCWCRARGRAWG